MWWWALSLMMSDPIQTEMTSQTRNTNKEGLHFSENKPVKVSIICLPMGWVQSGQVRSSNWGHPCTFEPLWIRPTRINEHWPNFRNHLLVWMCKKREVRHPSASVFPAPMKTYRRRRRPEDHIILQASLILFLVSVLSGGLGLFWFRPIFLEASSTPVQGEVIWFKAQSWRQLSDFSNLKSRQEIITISKLSIHGARSSWMRHKKSLSRSYSPFGDESRS